MSFGVWRSLVAHLVWDQGVQGSNPCTPTIFNDHLASQVSLLSKSSEAILFVLCGCLASDQIAAKLQTTDFYLSVAQLDRATAF